MQVEVYNKSDIEFVGTFRDKPITVPAKGSVTMGRSEAIKFLSEWSPVRIDGAGRHTAPKELVIREDPEQKAERYNQPLRYTAVDGTQFRTPQGVSTYEAKLREDVKEVVDAKPKRRRKVDTTASIDTATTAAG